MQVPENTKRMKRAVTANLFVRAALFGKIGMFPEHVLSGGDMQWTERATHSGFTLVHEPKAVVRHPARGFMALLGKSFRIGTGFVPIWDMQNISPGRRAHFIYKALIPRKPSHIRRLIEAKRIQEASSKFWRIWLIDYLCAFSNVLGIFAFYLKKLRKGPRRLK